METVPCPISGSTSFTPWLQVPDRFDVSGNTQWTLQRSSASGLIMLNPRPDSSEIAIHYHSGQYDPHLHEQSSTTFSQKAYLAARSILLRYRASLILKEWGPPLQKASILEIGCSTGDLLNFFHRKKGIPLDNLAGVEPEPMAADYALKNYGLRVYPSLLDEGAERKKFDRIVLWHTLEHIHAIHETLDYAAKRLAPDGVLIIALPNPESYDAKHYQENWIAWDAPRHLYHFVPGSLEKLLEAHNMTIFKRLPYLPDTLYNTFHSERLRCKRAGKGFHLSQIVGTVLKAAIATAIGGVWQLKASSLVYFVRGND